MRDLTLYNLVGGWNHDSSEFWSVAWSPNGVPDDSAPSGWYRILQVLTEHGLACHHIQHKEIREKNRNFIRPSVFMPIKTNDELRHRMKQEDIIIFIKS